MHTYSATPSCDSLSGLRGWLRVGLWFEKLGGDVGGGFLTGDAHVYWGGGGLD